MAQWRVPATNVARAHISVTCKQALRGRSGGRGWGGGRGGEEEGELATTSLEIEYLHRKSRREMLIGRDDI